jgi:cation transport ATPase
VKAHWRGKLPLGRSFWLNWIALYAVLILVPLAAGQVISSRLFFYGALALLLIVFVWGAVGVLRSAWRLIRSPDTPIRKVLAVVTIAIVAVALVFMGSDVSAFLDVLTR